jgi:two-component system NtrC family sensor kinase
MRTRLLPVKLICLFCSYIPLIAVAQSTANKDSLKRVFENTKSSKAKLSALSGLSDYYDAINTDSCIYYAKILAAEAVKVHDKSAETYAWANIAQSYVRDGNYVNGLALMMKCLNTFKQLNDSVKIANTYNALGNLYYTLDPKISHTYYAQCRLLSEKINDHLDEYWACGNLSSINLDLNRPDSALYYSNKGIAIGQQYHLPVSIAFAVAQQFFIYEQLHQNQKALQVIRKALAMANAIKDPTLPDLEMIYAKYLSGHGKPDSALIYAEKVRRDPNNLRRLYYIDELNHLLADVYGQKKQFGLAYKYQSLGIETRNKLYSTEKVKQALGNMFAEQQHQTELKNTAIANQNRIRLIAIALVLFLISGIALVLVRNNRQQRRANNQLLLQKKQIESTLDQLKSTQTQLIQREKMASLGELTAGIAHEIQNPLNFVNNFSEVNIELLDEMETELKSGDKDEAITLASDIRQNLEKIRHHGQRADSIVKGMLQHSGASSSTKEPTNVNKLADEYLRLAYNGLRAKDKRFNADLETNFDTGLPLVNLVPQDIGRVLLNLFNNAFYAVHQKNKQNPEGYLPQVTLTTINKGNFVEITVKDNGSGITDAIKDKIMQPFFTTKPTGEGTGLGLSLSYDIVVKGHGGSIFVDSKENEYAMFVINLPLK